MPDTHSEDATPRSRIRRLPDALVERIAAGEVVERPASVVRELLDNALDAGARTVRVEMRDGGLRLLRVSDDGYGIPPEELAIAIAPHTSNKVSTLDDLTHIRTLGFRGEALASIAAVADLEIASASDDSGLAEVVTTGPDASENRSTTARARGTTVAVRNLFGTVPARRAVLRGPRGEAARTHAVVRAYALAHPHVRFTLVGDGLLLLQTPGSDLPSAVTAVYGADAGKALLPIGPVTEGSASLVGIVVSRALSFAGRDHVVLVVNGRPIANRALTAAVEAGYRPLLRKGRHPLLVVHLAVPPERVDPNVHPAKADVLLRDESSIAAALRTAVHTALGAAPLSLGQETVAGLRERPIQLRLPAARSRYTTIAERASRRYAAAPQSAPDAPEEIGSLIAIGHFDNVLILARSSYGSLYLVDQHRAHERGLYEQLKRRAAALRVASPERDAFTITDVALPVDAIPHSHQLLLEPVLVELTPLQAARLSYRTEELAALGLDCQPFGGSVFLVRSLPGLTGAAHSPAGFAAELAAAAAEDADDWLDHLCVSLACRAAIRRGQPLAPPQQQQLLDDLMPLSARSACPHGSPLLVRLSRSYLARTFEW